MCFTYNLTAPRRLWEEVCGGRGGVAAGRGADGRLRAPRLTCPAIALCPAGPRARAASAIAIRDPLTAPQYIRVRTIRDPSSVLKVFGKIIHV